MANNHDLANLIYLALKDKGAGVGNASIGIIRKVLDEHNAVRPTLRAPVHRGVSVELPDYPLYELVEELKNGVYVQFVGVHALEWRSEWGRPKYGFIEYDPPNGG